MKNSSFYKSNTRGLQFDYGEKDLLQTNCSVKIYPPSITYNRQLLHNRSHACTYILVCYIDKVFQAVLLLVYGAFSHNVYLVFYRMDFSICPFASVLLA